MGPTSSTRTYFQDRGPVTIDPSGELITGCCIKVENEWMVGSHVKDYLHSFPCEQGESNAAFVAQFRPVYCDENA